MGKPEKKCPECGGRISWITVTALGAPTVNGMCMNKKCNNVFRGRESPEITRGKEMAKELEGVSCMDKRITRLPCNVQIGILRARQHPRGKKL